MIKRESGIDLLRCVALLMMLHQWVLPPSFQALKAQLMG